MGESIRPPDGDSAVLEKTEDKVTPPDMYKVVLLNDDFTPREFVVIVLVKVFHKSNSDADRIMMTAHRGGKAVVGTYTYDIATTRVSRARTLAKEMGYPLRFAVEGA
ncbi:MAG: ATP-dependent Clp protease adaptor ClpS [Spirochaetaceae bacterium]|nr:MAG: ATP-dependent Clp protease adaptor ClpS [Spirochaetaceae bacterium]